MELGERVAKSVDIIPTPEAEEAFLPHMLWQLRAVMDEVKPKDLLPSELIALLAVLVPAHSRVLVGAPADRPLLTVLQGGWTN
jgi:hypothetical protein